MVSGASIWLVVAWAMDKGSTEVKVFLLEKLTSNYKKKRNLSMFSHLIHLIHIKLLKSENNRHFPSL